MKRVLPLCLLLGACIEVPELDQAVPDWVDQSEYPALVPMDGVQTGQVLPETAAKELEDELTARAALLKQRATALNAQVVDQSQGF